MKTKAIVILLLASQCLWCRAAEEMSFQPVAFVGQQAPGLSTNVTFSSFNFSLLEDDGGVALGAVLFGPGVTITNGQGAWAGWPGDLRLLARSGAPEPGSGLISTLRFFPPSTAVGSEADAVVNLFVNGLGELSYLKVGSYAYDFRIYRDLTDSGSPLKTAILPYLVTASFEGNTVSAVGAYAELSGPDVGLTNDTAIVAGPPTNIMIVAREGFPAPGTSSNDASTNFISFPESPEDLAVAPDGRVIFSDVAGASCLNCGYGIWFGNATNLQAVVVHGKPAPDSLLGPGYTFDSASDVVSVNDRDEVAFVASLYDTNGDYANCLCAGPPGALRVVAESGRAAPGITNAALDYIGKFAISSDGGVAFEATYTGSSNAFGLWLAPTDGPPILIARNGAHAPGTPEGVVFAATSLDSVTPPFTDFYLNRQDQIAFRAELSGLGVGWPTNNIGIWLADPDGNVSLVARSGDTIQVAPGVQRQLADLTLGVNTVGVAGPGDGRRRPFNDRGEILFATDWSNPSGSSFHSTSGLFLAHPGIFLNAERSGNDILLQFPTLSGKHYRVDYKTDLSAPTWSVLDSSVSGSGGEVTVTNLASSSGAQYFRVVRTD